MANLAAIARYQGVNFAPGDVLIVRTGFVPWYESATDEDKARVFSDCTFAGVKQGEETQRWLWNNRFSGVAGDAVSWEGNEEKRLDPSMRPRSLTIAPVYPPPNDGSHLHQWLLPHAGIPIGELWNLEALGQACATHKKWTFLLTSAPLNIKGAVASPPNAVALL